MTPGFLFAVAEPSSQNEEKTSTLQYVTGQRVVVLLGLEHLQFKVRIKRSRADTTQHSTISWPFRLIVFAVTDEILILDYGYTLFSDYSPLEFKRLR